MLYKIDPKAESLIQHQFHIFHDGGARLGSSERPSIQMNSTNRNLIAIGTSILEILQKMYLITSSRRRRYVFPPFPAISRSKISRLVTGLKPSRKI